RDQLLRPGVQHGSDHAPGLLGLVGSDRRAGVAFENVEEQLPVGRRLLHRPIASMVSGSPNPCTTAAFIVLSMDASRGGGSNSAGGHRRLRASQAPIEGCPQHQDSAFCGTQPDGKLGPRALGKKALLRRKALRWRPSRRTKYVKSRCALGPGYTRLQT